ADPIASFPIQTQASPTLLSSINNSQLHRASLSCTFLCCLLNTLFLVASALRFQHILYHFNTTPAPFSFPHSGARRRIFLYLFTPRRWGQITLTRFKRQ